MCKQWPEVYTASCICFRCCSTSTAVFPFLFFRYTRPSASHTTLLSLWVTAVSSELMCDREIKRDVIGRGHTCSLTSRLTKTRQGFKALWSIDLTRWLLSKTRIWFSLIAASVKSQKIASVLGLVLVFPHLAMSLSHGDTKTKHSSHSQQPGIWWLHIRMSKWEGGTSVIHTTETALVLKQQGEFKAHMDRLTATVILDHTGRLLHRSPASLCLGQK